MASQKNSAWKCRLFSRKTYYGSYRDCLVVEKNMKLKLFCTSIYSFKTIEAKPLGRRRNSTCPVRLLNMKPITELKESSNTRPTGRIFPPSVQILNVIGYHRYSFHIRNSMLYQIWEYDDGWNFKWKLLFSRSRNRDILKEMHNSSTGAHFGVMKTLQRVRKRFYCSMAREDVEDWCCSCVTFADRYCPNTT